VSHTFVAGKLLPSKILTEIQKHKAAGLKKEIE
jgi:hypothetical protein